MRKRRVEPFHIFNLLLPESAFHALEELAGANHQTVNELIVSMLRIKIRIDEIRLRHLRENKPVDIKVQGKPILPDLFLLSSLLSRGQEARKRKNLNIPEKDIQNVARLANTLFGKRKATYYILLAIAFCIELFQGTSIFHAVSLDIGDESLILV